MGLETEALRTNGVKRKKKKSFKSFSFNVDWYAGSETLTEINHPWFQIEPAVPLSCDLYSHFMI